MCVGHRTRLLSQDAKATRASRAQACRETSEDHVLQTRLLAQGDRHFRVEWGGAGGH